MLWQLICKHSDRRWPTYCFMASLMVWFTALYHGAVNGRLPVLTEQTRLPLNLPEFVAMIFGLVFFGYFIAVDSQYQRIAYTREEKDEGLRQLILLIVSSGSAAVLISGIILLGVLLEGELRGNLWIALVMFFMFFLIIRLAGGKTINRLLAEWGKPPSSVA